jgi:elongation factor P
VAETVNTNQFKNGMHIELEGGVWRIVEFQHVKPGKGGAFVRTKLKSLDSGAVVDRTFRAGEKFSRVRTETKDMQYLYDSGDEVVFMDQDTYEQTSLPHGVRRGRARVHAAVELRADAARQRGAVRRAAARLGRAGRLGDRAGVKGRHGLQRDEAGDARDGAVVQVPLFVNTGDRIKVDPREKRYISRA